MDKQRSNAGADGAKIDVAELVAQHHKVLYAYAFRLTGNQPDAEDLVQQTFLTVQQKGDQIRRPEAVRGWLYTVLRNCFLKSYRRREPKLAENLDMDLNQFPQVGADELWFDEERLQQAIDGLPAPFRLVVLMFYFEECSYREIAEELELPIGTVMSRLSRAKRHLRSALQVGEDNAAASPEDELT